MSPKASRAGRAFAALLALTVLAGGARSEDIQGWPQLGRNPPRWNYAPQTIPPPYGVKWSARPWDDDPGERFYAAAQIVVGHGKAYLGSKSGRMYAFDAASGNIAWTFQAGGPILHTAGLADGKLFVAAMDGVVYALDARTGAPVWRFATGRRFGFSAAVLLAEGTVFAVDRGGRLFALKPADGTELWHYDAGAPVYQSPAANAGRVYFGSQDMHVHAVDARSGQRIWRSEQIDGRSLTDFWPVVFDGKVILRPRTGFEKSSIYQDRVKSFVVLDEATGREAFTVPFTHSGGWDGPVPPPPVTPDGKLVVHWHVVPSGGSFGGCGFALLDLATQKIARLLTDGTSRGIGARDETMIASVIGEMVFAIHHYGFRGNPDAQSGVFSLTEGKWYAGANPAGTAQHGELTDVGNLNSGGANAVSAGEGLLFHHTMHTIYCFGTAAPQTDTGRRGRGGRQ